MKLTIATGLYPPDVGGPATYAKLLHDRLAERGIETAVVSFRDVRHLPKLVRHIVYFIRVYRQARGAHVIYALDPVSVGLPAALAARARNARFLLRVAGDYAWEQGVQRFSVKDDLDTFSRSPQNHNLFVRLLVLIERWVAREADGMIVPSDYLRRIVASWGVSKNSIRVVHSAFEGIGSRGNRATLRAMLSFRGELIVSAGRLVPWKGFTALITLMPGLLKRMPSAKLMIVGDGPVRKELEQRIEDLGLEEHVILAGALDRPVLHSYIRAADVFVLNTSYEGFSHLLLEVMALGTPIVTTTSGGNPELLTDGKQALLVRYNDQKALRRSLEKLIGDRETAQRLSRSARGRVKHFSADRMLNELETILHEL